RNDDVVALRHLEGPEHRLDPGRSALDIDALVADGVAVPRGDGTGDDVEDSYVTVAEYEAPARDRVDGADVVLVEAIEHVQMAGQQGLVRSRRQVPDHPLTSTADRARDVAVVEQGRVGAEPLLAHELLVEEVALTRGTALLGHRVLRVSLGRDAAHRLVVRHCPRPCGSTGG